MTTVAVGADLLAALPATGGTAWIRGGEGIVGWGEKVRLDPGVGEGRFARAATELRSQLTEPGSVAFASFTFDPNASGSVVLVPAGLLVTRGGQSRMTGIAPPPADTPVRLLPPSRVVYAGSSVPELAWLEAVDAAAREIRGDSPLEKVVLARDLLVRAPDPLDVRLLAARLAERFPSCWTFLCDGLVGATPELLIRRTDRSVESLVLAGSAPRGTDPEVDARLGHALRTSAKNRTEHALSVASVRDALAPLCAQLHVEPEPSLLRLDNLQHLATWVRGTLEAPLTALEVAGTLHPTAAIGGTPTDLALERIRTLEGMDRGRYSGPVGWVDATGNGEFAIALRCAELTPNRARLFAGSGIVGDSLPESELEETRLKLRAMQSALEEG